MQQPTMPPPPAPAKSKSIAITVLLVIAAVAITLLVVGGGDQDHSSSPTTATDGAATAELIVNAMPTATKADFCTAYFQTNDYDFGLNAFSKGYDLAEPSAKEVFDELLSRC